MNAFIKFNIYSTSKIKRELNLNNCNLHTRAFQLMIKTTIYMFSARQTIHELASTILIKFIYTYIHTYIAND